MSASRMPHALRFLAAAAALCLAADAARADAYDDLVHYDWAQGRRVVAAIEADIREATTPEARRAIEARLLRALQHPEAGYACKQFVCRMLRRCGSEACVPAMAKLLGDPKLSHMARWALQHSPAAEATDALLDALGTAKGKLKLGIVASLGERGDPAAVPALARLAEADEPELARTAIAALGRVASSRAADALAGLRVAGPLAAARADALLACADGMLAEGKSVEAAQIYRRMSAQRHPTMVRVAALRGRVMAEKGAAVPTLLRLMRGDEPALAQAAKRFAMQVPGAEATEALAAALPDMPPEGQVMLLDTLSERGDPAAAPRVRGLLDGEHEEVRLAAIRALGVVGDAASVRPLARIAAAEGQAADAATQSLNRIQGEGVAEAMSKLLDSPQPALRAGILGVLATRADRAMIPAMLKAARDEDEAVRKAAAKGLEQVAGEDELGQLVQLLLDAKSSSERAALARALTAAARRVPDTEARAEPIVAGLERADAEAAARLLDVLSSLGGEKALDAARQRLDAKSPEVATAAVRALQDWPDPSPAEDLLRIIKTTDNPVHKVLAFRGYVRMASLAAQRPGIDAMAMYRQALDLAKTPAAQRSVLGGLANARSIEALDLVVPLLGQQPVRAEAEAACVRIAANAYDTAPDKARDVLQRIATTTQNDALRKQARSAIQEIDRNRGFIRTWLGSGPYTEGDAHKTAYAPEKEAEDAEWKLLTEGVGRQIIDLDKAIANGDHRAAYMKTHVWSPEAQPVQLQIGSDDSVKVWVNGQLVHANAANRGCKPNQDQVKTRLEKGWNKLMVKVSDNAGQWAFCVRVAEPDGSPLEGMRVSTEPE
ncbi:MAG: HEAT repeat domain-containing protein [Candidatus Brocadiia bacterium]